MIKRILLTLSVLLVAIFGLGWFLLFTASGLQVSSGLANMATGGSVSIGSSEGRVLGNWLLRDILITTRSVDIRIAELSCRWRPRRLLHHGLHIAALSARNLDISLKSGRGDDSAGETSFVPPAVAVPVPFLVGSLQIDGIEVGDDTGTALFDARSFSARLKGNGHTIGISDVRLDAPYLGVTGSGRLTMSEAWPLTVNADWWTRVDGCTKFSGSFEAGRTLTDPLLNLALTTPGALLVDADISSLFKKPSYELSVTGSELILADFCMPVTGIVDDLRIEIGGDPINYDGRGQASVTLIDELPVSVQIGFSGDRESLNIDTGSFSSGPNRIDASGSLHFGPALGWNSVLRTSGFDISELIPVPETLINGNLNVYGEVKGNQVSYDADLRDLSVSIREHNLEIGGGLSLHGDGNGLDITHSSFVCGDGTIGVQGKVDWQQFLSWETDIILDEFNPAVIALFPEGRISGALNSTGSVEDAQLAVQAEITSLTGELSGYELAGEGAIVYRDSRLTVKDLNITNGNNSFRAGGDIDNDYNLTFQVNGSELERIFPQLGGTLNVSGTMNGARSAPVLNLRADGKDLHYEDHSLESLQASAAVDFGDRTIAADLDFDQVTSGSLHAKQVTLGLDGSMADHAISGGVTLPRATLSIDAHGSVSDDRWLGEISRLTVVDEVFGKWQTRNPVHIDGGAASVIITGACLFSDENGLCVDMNWDHDKSWSLAATDVRFDLSTLNRWGFLNAPLSGIVDGEISAGGLAAEINSLSGHAAVKTVQWDPGPNSYYQDFKWFDTSCSVNLVDRDLLVGIATRFIDNSRAEAEISLIGAVDFPPVEQLPLTGQVNLDLKDLKPLSVVTAEFLVPEGHVSGRVDVGGTLGAPLLTGDVSLLDGGLHVPFLGVDLSDVEGAFEMAGSSLTLDLDSRAGEGELNIAGGFQFGADDWSGQLKFIGSNCSLLDRRAISAEANPNLELKIGSDGGSLTGRVDVQQALLEVKKIDRSATESGDVVFVDKMVESTPWPFHYNIDVSLGEDVRVEGFGLDGKLDGNLKVSSNTDGTTSGRGLLDVREGSFVVYGSPLTISRGRLLFDGGPVDNPGIDIKASKFIDERQSGFDTIEVGANVTGSAAEFEVELYSVPKMEEADILTYILFDNPFSSESGDGGSGLISSVAQTLGLRKGSDLMGDVNSMLPVDEIRLEGGVDSQETSLVVGKKLSKDLSVSYDYNLFKNAGSFRVRYEFGKGFSVESRNSFESNAVELLYSFER